MRVHKFSDREAVLRYLRYAPEVSDQLAFEAGLARRHGSEESFLLDGWCRVCEAPTAFTVDRNFGARETAEGWTPNWRERLVCAGCGLNNRQRAVVGAVKGSVADRGAGAPLTLYATEQVTSLFRSLAERLPEVTATGSEYLGPGLAGGSVHDGVVPGIRHEDVEALSFADGSFDLVVSNDVLEHVDAPQRGVAELCRVLKPGGEAFVTIPFHLTAESSSRRAALEKGEVRHLTAAEYHGNPLSTEGSLVFHDFGWDFIAGWRDAGFTEVVLCLYWSYLYGHLGCPQYYFRGFKPG